MWEGFDSPMCAGRGTKYEPTSADQQTMARIRLLGELSGRVVLEGTAHGRAPAIAYGLAMVRIKHSWADGGDLGEGLSAGDRLQVRIVEVIKHNDFVSCICKHDDRVAADESCAATNQDCLGHVSELSILLENVQIAGESAGWSGILK